MFCTGVYKREIRFNAGFGIVNEFRIKKDMQIFCHIIV
jgi:hypothetical protein